MDKYALGIKNNCHQSEIQKADDSDRYHYICHFVPASLRGQLFEDSYNDDDGVLYTL